MTDFIPPYPKPLKKLPGPVDLLKIARSDLLSIWPESAYERQFMNFKLINRTLVIANHPEIVRHTLVDNPTNYQRKSSLVKKILAPLLGDSLFIGDGSRWECQRALGESVLATQTTTGYGDSIVDITDEWGQKWLLSDSNALLVLTEMKQLVAAVHCRILFDCSLKAEKINHLSQLFDDYFATIEQLDLNALFGLPGWFTGKKSAKSAQLVKSIHAWVDQIIAEQLAGEDKGSLLSRYVILSEKSQVNSQFGHEQIRNNVIGLFLAGHEAMANTLAWAWYLLSHSPEVEQKLYEELAGLGDRPATVADLNNLTYTLAVIKETLRLYPPFPLLIRESANDDVIRKRAIPAGSFLFVAPWLLHRHKKYWDKPNHFVPERFLADAPKPEPFTYLPFGVGPRACLGEELALLITTLCLANLTKRFRLQADDGYQVMPVSRLILRPSNLMPMRLIART